MSAIVGHQGGWDELLLVATPLVLFAVLLAVAARRARQEADREASPAQDSGPTGDDTQLPDA